MMREPSSHVHYFAGNAVEHKDGTTKVVDFGEMIGNLKVKGEPIEDSQGWFSHIPDPNAWKLGDPIDPKLLRKKGGRWKHQARVASMRSLRMERGDYRTYTAPPMRVRPHYSYSSTFNRPGKLNLDKQHRTTGNKWEYRTRLGRGPWSKWKSRPRPKWTKEQLASFARIKKGAEA